MSRKVEKTPSCINCSTPLMGENYCPECGQINDTRRPGLGSFIAESLGNFFAFDSKFFKTIGHLFWRPGIVALEYVQGKKVTWMKPVRLYFLSSLIFLFFGGIGGEQSLVEIKGLDDDPKNEAIVDSLEIPSDTNDVDAWKTEKGYQKMYSYLEYHPKMTVDSALVEMNIDDGLWNRFLYKQLQKQFNMEQEDFKDFLETKTFWILFLFLPLFSFWLKLVYRKKDIYYLEHLFFAFYTQSAFFLILSLTSINELLIGIPYFNPIAIIGFAIYLFLALRNFYKQSIGKTVFKLLILNLGYAVFAILFLLLTLLIGYIAF